MSDVVEYGPSGPTQVKDISPPSNMSPQAAAFIAANASPFTNPRDLPASAKVPDPRNTMDTDTMFIWGHVEVPAHVLSTGAYGLTILSNPDPLAPLPLWVSQTSDTTWGTTKPSAMSPNTWAAFYDKYGLHDVIAQCDMLSRRAKSYRVVGHGLKAWCSRSATMGTGNITGYQVDLANAGSFCDGNAVTNANNAAAVWSNVPTADAGFQASLLTTSCSTFVTPVLNAAKNDEIGFLQADEGVTVRWTDRSDFAFKPVASKLAVHAFRRNVATAACDDVFQAVNEDANGFLPGVKSDGTGTLTPASCIFAMPPFTTIPATSGNNINCSSTSCRLGSYMSTGSAVSAPQHRVCAISADLANYYIPPTSQTGGSYGSNTLGTTYMSYANDPSAQFDTALAVEVAGLATGATVIIQAVWHIEYVPQGLEPWSSALPSPVDLQYDVYAALLRDRRAFPIIVKGHSFFSNLRKALAKAGKALGKVFGGVGAASAALAVVPGLQPFAALGGSIAAVGGATIGAVSMIDAAYDEIAASGRAAKRALRG